MKIYLRILSITYFIGFVLHVADVLDLRLKFSSMDSTWQAWIVYLCVLDLIVAIGLWKQKRWGIILFLVVAISQLIAYLGFISKFGRQDFLVGFHVATLVIYGVFHMRALKRNDKPASP